MQKAKRKTEEKPSRKPVKATKKLPEKTIAENKTVTITIKIHSDKKGGHPHVVLENIDKNHVSVGLSTHPKKGRNSPNYKLTINPLGGDEQSYMRRQGTVAPVGEYSNPRKGKMTPKDYNTAKRYGGKAKNKYIEKKNKKK